MAMMSKEQFSAVTGGGFNNSGISVDMVYHPMQNVAGMRGADLNSVALQAGGNITQQTSNSIC